MNERAKRAAAYVTDERLRRAAEAHFKGERIKQAAAASDRVVDAFNEAQNHLKLCFINGAGVLSDPSLVRGDLREAKRVVEEALKTMDETHWPQPSDYD